MLSLTDEQNESFNNQKLCHICKNKFHEVHDSSDDSDSLIVFDDMIADVTGKKKLYLVVTELFIREWKLNISLVLITQSYFPVPKDVRLNTKHIFIMEFSKKREFELIDINHSSDIDSKDLMELYRNCTAEPYSFLVTMLLFHQIVHYIFERIYWKKYREQC